MIDHINAAIEELESAKDLIKESYIGTCTTSYDRKEVHFNAWDGGSAKTNIVTTLVTEDDGDPRLLKALDRLENQIAILQSMVEKIGERCAIDRQYQRN